MNVERIGGRYKRILIKLSGEAFAGDHGTGFQSDAVDRIAEEVIAAKDQGFEVALVVGGGNIFRGTLARHWGIDRAEADNVGMLGTIVNSLILRGALKSKSRHEVRVMTSIAMEAIAEPYIRLRAIHHLERGYIVIFAGGIGQPYVTTDYPAVQRALEVGADAIFVAKNGVDGVYTADPRRRPDARRYRTMRYNELIKEDIRVMDQSAIILARDNGLPIHIFGMEDAGAVKKIAAGEHIGTLVSPKVDTCLDAPVGESVVNM
jgi:uridylate kinase